MSLNFKKLEKKFTLSLIDIEKSTTILEIENYSEHVPANEEKYLLFSNIYQLCIMIDENYESRKNKSVYNIDDIFAKFLNTYEEK